MNMKLALLVINFIQKFYGHNMRLIRWFIGKLILFINLLTLPKPILREKSDQNKIDNKTKYLTIYQFEACPFCVKVRRFIKKNILKLNLRMRKIIKLLNLN